MNREQMIERAFCAIWSGCEGSRVQAEIEARNVVDAILPQVTTVEELEALNRDALVTSATQPGVIPVPVWRIFAGLGWDGEPLTVVWQP